jgi:hypothetical protein
MSLECDAHGIKYARDTFAEYGIDVSNVEDVLVVKAYNSILDAAAIMARPAGDFFIAIRNVREFVAQPRLNRNWNLGLNELLR